MSTPISPRHAAALSYAAAGVPVFPCAVGGKRPATLHGFLDRTLDSIIINNWWTRNDYNLAIVPEDGGWAVLDIDPKNGGLDTLTQIESKLPVTRKVITPSGGYHLYYFGTLPSTAGRLGRGIDTRGRDSYVLVPPSVIDGVEYRASA